MIYFSIQMCKSVESQTSAGLLSVFKLFDRCILNFIGNSYPANELQQDFQPKVIDYINNKTFGRFYYAANGTTFKPDPIPPNVFTKTNLNYNNCIALILTEDLFENPSEKT